MVKNKRKNLRMILVVLLVLISSFLTVVLYLFPILKHSYADTEIKKIYFAENITSAHTYLINEFNKLNKGKIKVIPINLPYEKFSTNKRKELITKNLRNRTSRIDIYAIDIVWNDRFEKWAEPLNNYFTKKELSKIIDEAKYYCYSESTLYSVPFFIDIGVLYYRDDLLKKNQNYSDIIRKLKNGICWDDLKAYKFKNSKYKYLFQADSYEGLMCNFLELVGENTFLDKDGKVTIDKNIIDRLNNIQNLIYKEKIIPKEVTNFDESISFNYALENDIPFFRGWPTGKKTIQISKELAPKVSNLKFAPLPKFKNDKSVSTIGGWNLIISKNSRYKNESIEFIKFLLSEKSQQFIWENSGYLPIINYYYYDSVYTNKYPELKLFKQLIQNGVYRIKHPQYTKISDILTKNLNLYFRRQISINEFIQSTLAEINSITKEN